MFAVGKDYLWSFLLHAVDNGLQYLHTAADPIVTCGILSYACA